MAIIQVFAKLLKTSLFAKTNNNICKRCYEYLKNNSIIIHGNSIMSKNFFVAEAAGLEPARS